MNLERFSDPSKKILALARKEAIRLQHEVMGTEHLLLALIQEKDCTAAEVLRNLGVDLMKTKRELERGIEPGPKAVPRGSMPLSPRLNRVLELSVQEADGLRHKIVGTEHLLLGLLRDGEGLPAQLLLSLGQNLEDVREEVSALLFWTPAGQEAFLASLTQGARRAIDRACDEADQLVHDPVDAGHLLLGLIQERKGVAGGILKKLGVRHKAAQARIEEELNSLPRPKCARILWRHWRRMRILGIVEFKAKAAPRRLSEGAAAILSRAGAESRRLGDRSIGTEHILLALIGERDGVPAKALEALGAAQDEIRTMVLQVLGQREMMVEIPPDGPGSTSGPEGSRGS